MDQGSSRKGGPMCSMIEDIIGAVGLFVMIYLIFILI